MVLDQPSPYLIATSYQQRRNRSVKASELLVKTAGNYLFSKERLVHTTSCLYSSKLFPFRQVNMSLRFHDGSASHVFGKMTLVWRELHRVSCFSSAFLCNRSESHHRRYRVRWKIYVEYDDLVGSATETRIEAPKVCRRMTWRQNFICSTVFGPRLSGYKMSRALSTI